MTVRALRILVVDDEESIRYTLSEYLNSAGYEVVAANDGADALQKFIHGKFDCIVSDFMMPRIDGLELLKRIRIMDSDVIFIMITGFSKMDTEANAIEEGAYAYLTKPFRLADIKLKIEQALSIRETGFY